VIHISDTNGEQLAPLRGLATRFGWNVTPLDSVVTAPRRIEEVPGDAMDFLRDARTAQGQLMHPGEEFTKAWEIRTSGVVPWFGRQLVRVGAYSGEAVISSAPTVPLPDIYPPEGWEVEVELRAPVQPGSYVCYWEMASQGHEPAVFRSLGQLSCAIVVI
jgi:hypothetical protein